MMTMIICKKINLMIPLTPPCLIQQVSSRLRLRQATCIVQCVIAIFLLVLAPAPATATSSTSTSRTTTTAEPSSWIRRTEEDDNDDSRRDNNKTTSSQRLEILLASHDLTTTALASMAKESYFPQSPYNVSQYNISNYWTASIVTPIPQGINGSLIQAVLFENPSKLERVLTFMGVYLNPADPAKGEENYANPYSTCLAADYEFAGTAAEAAMQAACEEFGRVDTKLHDWRKQAKELIGTTSPTFLTGHSQGCTLAMSESLLSYTYNNATNNNTSSILPTVCFSNPGGLTQKWMESYDPELVIRMNGNDDENNNNMLPPPAIWNQSIYTLQTWTDPLSNCLEPVIHNTNTSIATLCSFAGSSVPACGLNTTFSHQVFSPCVEQSHYVDNLQSVPEVFSTNACTTDQTTTTTTTSDWTGRGCPHNNNSNAVIVVGGDDDDDDDNNSDLSSVLPSDSSSSGIRVDLDYTFMCTSSLVCLFILAARQFG